MEEKKMKVGFKSRYVLGSAQGEQVEVAGPRQGYSGRNYSASASVQTSVQTLDVMIQELKEIEKTSTQEPSWLQQIYNITDKTGFTSPRERRNKQIKAYEQKLSNVDTQITTYETKMGRCLEEIKKQQKELGVVESDLQYYNNLTRGISGEYEKIIREKSDLEQKLSASNDTKERSEFQVEKNAREQELISLEYDRSLAERELRAITSCQEVLSGKIKTLRGNKELAQYNLNRLRPIKNDLYNSLDKLKFYTGDKPGNGLIVLLESSRDGIKAIADIKTSVGEFRECHKRVDEIQSNFPSVDLNPDSEQDEYESKIKRINDEETAKLLRRDNVPKPRSEKIGVNLNPPLIET